jgi:hypothetical protein
VGWGGAGGARRRGGWLEARQVLRKRGGGEKGAERGSDLKKASRGLGGGGEGGRGGEGEGGIHQSLRLRTQTRKPLRTESMTAGIEALSISNSRSLLTL